MKKNLRDFIGNIESSRKKEDSCRLVELMEKASGYDAYLSGSIVGFGEYHYKYESGREGDSVVTGFSPRKQNIAIYIMPGFSAYEKELSLLGKYKLGKSCLYINKLSDINEKLLVKIVEDSVKTMKGRYVCKNA